MSHIDKALRTWEGSIGIDRSDDSVIPSSGRLSVQDYAREDPAPSAPPKPKPLSRKPAEQPPSEPLERNPVERVSLRSVGQPTSPPSRPPRPPARRPVEETAPAPVNRDAVARLVTGSSNGLSIEQYRRLAASLHDAQVGNGLKTVMLTSSVPREGKTLTTVNLALTLSESYARRVLVIDADLRSPSVHSVLRVSNTRGLGDVLADEHLELPLVAVSDSLFVLTAGQPGPAPLAGLSSPRMGALLEECGRHFDWVILDTPPVGVLPDAQLLARLAGAVVFVIGGGSTPAAVVERAIAELGPECIIGTVLNRVDTKAFSEAYYYDRYATKG